ncbi:MAG: ATP-binding protein [Burkholderiales bacterium]|nr:ATP-binding protein [Burkholderiales bacterium]
MCHFLAQGKRVLVTSKGETALSVLREKLPERVQPLSVALLSDERDGMRQFEHAIHTISSTVSDLRPAQVEEHIAGLSAALTRLHGQIHMVDQQITSYASQHLEPVRFQGKEVMPNELAKQVVEQADAHGWFEDNLESSPGGPVPIGEPEMRELRAARIKAAEHLRHLHDDLPANDSLPTWDALREVHRALVRAKTIDTQVQMGDVLPLRDTAPVTLDSLRDLQQWMHVRQTTVDRLHRATQAWLPRFEGRLRRLPESDLPLMRALRQETLKLAELESQRKTFVAEAVDVPSDSHSCDDLREALDRLTQGKSAFFLPFGKAEARKVIEACKVQGAAPASALAWSQVAAVLNWRDDARQALARWASVGAEFGITPPEDRFIEQRVRQAAEDGQLILTLTDLVFRTEPEWPERLQKTFTDHAHALDLLNEDQRKSVEESVSAHLERQRLDSATMLVQDLQTKLQAHSGLLSDSVREFLDMHLGSIDAEETKLQENWVGLQRKLLKLNGLQPAFGVIQRVTQALRDAGAEKWSSKLCGVPVKGEADPLTPATWMDAWEWRQARDFLERIDKHHQLHTLFAKRKDMSNTLVKTYQDLVAEKTWLGVYNNSPDRVRQALQAYMNAVHAMGKGTGVRAVRFRKDARDAMSRAYLAVPCWVLPHWRVSETLPAEMGLFDLVIIDEASQSDISALPCLLRAKKVLVVGDHKQVSPSAVGTAEGQIRDLVHRFLSRQPHGSEMTPDKSIYDLARVVFAGNAVMLKEHFRSVPAIIEYSNREFYQGSIRPLRVPKANERLDPPLIDVFVQGGRREGDINKAEAQAILDDIEAIVEDPAMVGRTVGVVTLVGTKQAKHIHDLLHQRIAPADIVNREIVVGPPPVFQGRERDIMLVSLVLGPADRATADRLDMQQRYNVALSRARDRMMLYRSVQPGHFREDTLTGKLLQHFQHPFQRDVQKTAQLRERCDSPFECEVFDELTQRGYRVEPQVACGGFFIDMVVEGAEGRRLAVECDGDQYHGPGKWVDDMRRQRILERAGWTFWRSFASSFVRQREAVLEDLLKTLNDLGIEPVGAESVASSFWVQHREVDPFRVLDESEEEAA